MSTGQELIAEAGALKKKLRDMEKRSLMAREARLAQDCRDMEKVIDSLQKRVEAFLNGQKEDDPECAVGGARRVDTYTSRPMKRPGMRGRQTGAEIQHAAEFTGAPDGGGA